MTTPLSASSRSASRRNTDKAVSTADAMPVVEPVFPRHRVRACGTKAVALRLPIDQLPKRWRGRSAGGHLMAFLLGVLHGPAGDTAGDIADNWRKTSVQVWLYGLDEDTSAELDFRDFRTYWQGANFRSIYVIFSMLKGQPFFWQWLEACFVSHNILPEAVVEPRRLPYGAVPVLALDRGRLVQYVTYVTADEAAGPVPVILVPELSGPAVSYGLYRLDLDAVVREVQLGQCSLKRPSLPLPAVEGCRVNRLELRQPRIVE